MSPLPSPSRSSAPRPASRRSRLARIGARLGAVLLVASGLALTTTPAQAAPGDVAITSPADATAVHVAPGGAAAATITGTGEPGESIVVKVVNPDHATDAWGPQSVTVSAAGTWSITTSALPAIAAGEWYVIQAQVLGYPATNSAQHFFSIRDDATSVNITAPTDGATITMPIGATTVGVHVTGQGTHGETVTVTTGSLSETAAVQSGGNWTTAPIDLGVGTHTLTASQPANPAGTDSITVTVVANPADVRITAPAAGSTISLPGTTLVVAGTGVAGHQVAVRVDVIGVQTVTVDASGNWTASFTLTAAGRFDIQALDLVNDSRALSSVVVSSINGGAGNGGGSGTGNGSGGGQLAATGARESALAAGAALLLIATGAALQLVRRRRFATN